MLNHGDLQAILAAWQQRHGIHWRLLHTSSRLGISRLRPTDDKPLNAHRLVQTVQCTLWREAGDKQGVASFAVDGPIDNVVFEQSVRQAFLQLGRVSQPLRPETPRLAPAHVKTADPFLTGDLLRAISRIETDLRKALSGMRTQSWDLEIEHTQKTLMNSGGFTRTFESTRFGATCQIEQAGRSSILRTHGGEYDSQWIAKALAEADSSASGLVKLATGIYDCVIPASTLFATWQDHHFLQPIFFHADSSNIAQGISRFVSGQPAMDSVVGDGAAAKLSIFSEGTRALAQQSTPVDDSGGAIRNFWVMRDGLWQTPGSSVRNLRVECGEASGDEIRFRKGRPLLVVHDLSIIAMDPLAGSFLCRINRVQDGPSNALWAGNFFGLQTILLSHEEFINYVYRGPALWRFDEITLVNPA